MKTSEIRDLSDREREDKIRDLQEELFNLKFQLATGKIENPSQLRLLRRDIAKIKTIQHEQVSRAKTEAENNQSPQQAAE
ncbi:MAG: 50S ribosomal protein L29 [Nitrospinales bacterium]